MNLLRLQILPSGTSNDHQVRIFVDDNDWLGEDPLGIDPPMFFSQRSLLCGGELLAGRCECGVEGCDDVCVRVGLDGETVTWKNDAEVVLTFRRDDYEAEISRASKDFSWEDENRTVERLVGNVFANAEIDGFAFNWASARVRAGVITLSFSKDGVQKLIEFGWVPGCIEDAVETAKRIYREKIAT